MARCVVCGCASGTLFCSQKGHDYISCKDCGHVYERHISNTFDAEDRSFDKKATHHISGPKQEWDFSEIKRAHVFRPRLTAIEKHMAPGKLLDIGCSNGAFIEAANAYGWDASGVELRDSSADFAQGRGLRVYRKPLQDLAFPDEQFDVITMWQVLEHIPDPQALLAECRRIIGTGGVLALSTPNIKSIGWKLLKSDWPAIAPGCHHHLFSIDTLDRLLNQCGFQKCVLETLDLQPATIKQVKRMVSGKPKSKPSNAMASLVSSSSPEKLSRLFKYRKVINYPLKWTGLGEDLCGEYRKQ